MADDEIQTIHHLAKYVPCSHDKLTTAVLRLLFNLSFNQNCRQQMVLAGFLEKVRRRRELRNDKYCF